MQLYNFIVVANVISVTHFLHIEPTLILTPQSALSKYRQLLCLGRLYSAHKIFLIKCYKIYL